MTLLTMFVIRIVRCDCYYCIVALFLSRLCYAFWSHVNKSFINKQYDLAFMFLHIKCEEMWIISVVCRLLSYWIVRIQTMLLFFLVWCLLTLLSIVVVMNIMYSIYDSTDVMINLQGYMLIVLIQHLILFMFLLSPNCARVRYCDAYTLRLSQGKSWNYNFQKWWLLFFRVITVACHYFVDVVTIDITLTWIICMTCWMI